MNEAQVPRKKFQKSNRLWIQFLAVLFVAAWQSGTAQKKPGLFQHVEPAFWWIGMKNTTVQILFHSSDAELSSYQVISNYPGVSVKDVTKVENKHFLFVTLELSSNAKAGSVPLQFRGNKKEFIHSYELKNKSTDANRILGFSSADVLYLIMPDRFANGDSSNDTISGMYQGTHRDLPFGRHGGDLKGISDHLDYLHDLGVTALWLNPVLENNQKRESYHGYAITDLYKVDRRFGTNEEYLGFIDNCHRRGMKVIQDMVLNHIGSEHWLMYDLPERDWVHQFPEFTRSNYRSEVVSDPYRSTSDLNKMSNGWFDKTMPDVNQTNPQFATYLIQNSLWWIEYAGIDGIRMDTYPYPDKTFMARWASSIMQEYPRFNIVGEVLMNSLPITAYWKKGTINQDGYQSQLPTVIDFPLTNAMNAGLNEKGSWDGGLTRLYSTLSHDFIYPDPNGNVTFLDNHDMSRFYYNMGRNMNKFKMGLTFLLTTRGIPQLYYGTELLMDGDYSIHPTVRRDVPGGWKEDKVNSFLPEGRTAEQEEGFNYLKKLLNWRKNEPVIHHGKLTHYIPEDNVYVYFRFDDNKTVMIIMNGNEADKKVKTGRFKENIKNHITATNVLTGGKLDLGELTVPAQTALILELN
jgi:glycosidase